MYMYMYIDIYVYVYIYIYIYVGGTCRVPATGSEGPVNCRWATGSDGPDIHLQGVIEHNIMCII